MIGGRLTFAFALFLSTGMTCLGGEIVFSPAQIELTGPVAGAQVLVTTIENGRQIDLTREAVCTLQPGSAECVEWSDRKWIAARADGQAKLLVSVRGASKEIPVRVSGVAVPPPTDFERDVQPVLTKFACNAGACHGKQRGQNGFQLSLLAFDSDFDFDVLTKEARGRRIDRASPNHSLLLQKPTGEIPHGGGKRLELGRPPYQTIVRWISEGMPRKLDTAPALKTVQVEPAELVLNRGAMHQVRVTATYTDGSTRDVTSMSAYLSNESAVASVDDSGLITAGRILGDTAVMCRYQGMIAVCTAIVPHPEPAPAALYAALPRRNFIDEQVWKRLEKLGVAPSEPAAESTVLRRLYLDLLGRGPTAEEARVYLTDSAADKRDRLIDQLLNDQEFSEHWASKWADLLRPNPYRVGIKSTLSYDNWIRNSFRQNKPYDQFVKELINARGSTWKNGSVVLFRDRREPDEITTLVSQLFLGVRLECAKCHHHPFEVYGQDDFYSFAAYFAKLGRKGTGLSTPISGSEEFVFAGRSGAVRHPLSGKEMSPKPLFGTAPPTEGLDDPREALAAWVISDQNPYFSRAIANRIWADMMGRGLVEPVDDLRGTNPASNPELLEALAQDIRQQKYDLKQLVKRIATSYVYGLSSVPSSSNAADHRNFSRHYRQRLRAEVLFDTLCQVTGVPENFDAMPEGSRAKQLWTVRADSLFLDAFGRQDPNQDPPCERTTESTVVQALHLMNSNQLSGRILSDQGWAAKLAESDATPVKVVEQMYLAAYSRFPTEAELKVAVATFPTDGASRRPAIEDLMWALLNTAEFVFED